MILAGKREREIVKVVGRSDHFVNQLPSKGPNSTWIPLPHHQELLQRLSRLEKETNNLGPVKTYLWGNRVELGCY
jgi:hypothetical protein